MKNVDATILAYTCKKDGIVSGNMREYLLNSRHNRTLVFRRVEQGSGKYKNDLFVFFVLSLKLLAYKWIREVHGKEFRIHDNRDHETSVSDVDEDETEYLNNVKALSKPNFTKEELRFNRSDQRAEKK